MPHMDRGYWRPGFCALLLAAIPTLFSLQVLAEEPVSFSHRGVKISGVPKAADANFDIDITAAADGANLVRDALDILYEGSEFNAQAIDRLKATGNVVIIYDPAFPPSELNKVTIAAFLPDFYKAGSTAQDFVAVVGRFGAKWQARDLAPVLAHELTGHGVQHMRGRLEHVREVDLECEAYLYQEKAYQDLKISKQTAEMVAFRQTLERHWCADFRTWQKKSRPKNVANWDKLNPDVPKILEDYLVYIDTLRTSGVAGAAVQRAKQAQKKQALERIKELAASDDPAGHYELSIMYARGIGVAKNEKESAAWLEKAAIAGDPRAQYDLARVYWQGAGVTADRSKAAHWTRMAAENGNADAAYTYGVMLIKGQGIDKDPAAGRAFVEKAAKAGLARAQKALDILNKQPK